MLRNYFTIAWRTLLNNRLYSLINIFGLTVGISSCLVIYLIVTFELSFNKGIADGDRIYRIYSSFSGDFEGTNRGVSTGVQTRVTEQFTGLDAIAPFHTYSAKVIIPGLEQPRVFEVQKEIIIAAPSYFQLINQYSWISGTPEMALGKPRQVVLTSSQARKYFGTEVPSEIIGKEIQYNDSLVLTVAGLVHPLSGHTDFAFTDFISSATIETSTFLKNRMSQNDWGSTNSSTQLFIKLSPETSVSSIEQQLTKLDEEYKAHHQQGDWTQHYKLQPFADLHFNGYLGIFDTSRPPAHLSTLSTLSIVAVILLLLASINFVNLETARAVKRAKEVGIRKVLGSSRGQLMRHFLAQSILLSLVAVLLAIPMAEMGLIFFSDFVPPGVELALSDVSNMLFLIGVVLTVGVFSGMYPAFVLSSFLPALALKNQSYINSSNSRSAYLRKGLIVFQFASAQLLIIGTLVIVSQINFMLDKDLGFEKDAIIHIEPPWQEKGEKRFVLRNELERIPDVLAMTMCQSPPSANGFSSNILTYKKGTEEIRTSSIRKFGDPNYLSVYGIKLIAGRNLAPNHKTEILVNEAFLKEIGLTPDKALGEEVFESKRTYTIVGVMKDYHIFSLHAPFKPVYMCGYEEDLYGFSLKLRVPEKGARNFSAVIAKMGEAWDKVYPERKFQYEFVDETVRNFYQTEEKMSKLSGTAMLLAIIISCLGLFGLASYTSIQRSKEMGIRKVLGASVRSILVLLSGDFLKLVLVAFVVATPLAVWGAEKFLEDYTFHINLSVPLFIYGGASSMVLAFLTVSYQALESAWMNPVDSLRSE